MNYLHEVAEKLKKIQNKGRNIKCGIDFIYVGMPDHLDFIPGDYICVCFNHTYYNEIHFLFINDTGCIYLADSFSELYKGPAFVASSKVFDTINFVRSYLSAWYPARQQNS